jgi:hypothetical protein
VVQRTDLDLDTEQARSLAYLDNRVAELDLDWDVAALLEDRDGGLDLSAVGFTEQELDELLARDELPGEFREYDESVADEVKYCTCPECGHRFPQ